MKVYKILTQEEWNGIGVNGQFLGAEIDLRDGYIHLSNREQVEDTLRLHFKGRTGLILLEFEASDLRNLKHEVSRNGDLFPHLYDSLDVNVRTEMWYLNYRHNGVSLPPW